MSEALADDALRRRGVAVLEQYLGPAKALRFLALISREPFDYQSWRDQHFAGKTLDELLAASREAGERS